MKFGNLKIENFLTITEGSLNLADRGLVAIQGVHSDDSSADSNGAGKSSFVDGLCWVLYGVTARNVSGDDVINNRVGKGTRGEIEVIDGSDIYRIARHRKHKTGKNSLTVQHEVPGAAPVDLTKGTDKLTQEVVNKIIGASHDVFSSAVYAGQERMPDLPAMTDKQLKVLIEEAAGVNLLEEAYRLARENLAAEKAKSDHLVNESSKVSDRITMIEQQVTDADAEISNWEANRKVRIQSLRKSVEDLVAKVKSTDAEITKIDEAKIDDGIAKCDAKIAAVRSEQDEVSTLSGEKMATERQRQQARDHVADMVSEVAFVKKEINEIGHKVGCPCDECGREITENEVAAARLAAERRLATAEGNLFSAKADYEAAEEAALKARQALTARQGSLTDVSEVTRIRGDLTARKSTLQALKDTRNRDADQARWYGEEAKKIAVEENPFVSTKQKAEKTLEDAREALQKVDEQLKNLAVATDIADTVVKVFSPAGVRAHILDEVTPFLNQQTSKYLSILSDGNIDAIWTTLVRNAKGELREKFSIEVTKAGGSQSFAGLSGGEKRKVRVAAALALQDLVATRATKPIDLFIGDEIDDALDPAGLERLMTILDEKAKECGSVFVISHNSLRDWISQIVTVETSGGVTKVTETKS